MQTEQTAIPEAMRTYGPWVMQDAETKREWLFPETPRYYVHRDAAAKWVVIDRWEDQVVGVPHSTRGSAIRTFYLSVGRPIPDDTDLPVFNGSNFDGV